MIHIFIILALFSAATAREGVDMSYFEGELTPQILDCLVENNKTFAIIEVWKHQWGINQYFNSYLEQVQAKNFAFADAYAFVCNECVGNTPQNICSSINSTLPANFAGHLWIDIEPCDGCWSISYQANFNFVESVIDECSKYGFNLGIYSTKYCWTGVVGNYTSEKLTNLPLWYAHWDNNSNYDDFANYGVANWSKPYMKQITGLADLCGTQIDLDYFPSDEEEITQ